MKIPKTLLDVILEGKAIPILGVGASIGAKDKRGNNIPDTNELKNLIIKKFLNVTYQEDSLALISEIAKNESSFLIFQEYIHEIFKEFEPAEFHKILPTFRWRAIVTTNFDLIIEKAYNSTSNRIQNLRPIISDDDPIDLYARSIEDLTYLKLHGCISKTQDLNTPIILTLEQYVNFSQGRKRLFNNLIEWGYENTYIIIGHSMKDPDLLNILSRLISLGIKRPEYYLVIPNMREEEIKYWQTQRISYLKGTFQDFLVSLDSEIPRQNRKLTMLVQGDNPIEKKIISRVKMSKNCFDFLNNDADYVSKQLKTEQGSAVAFYKGFNFEWYPILENLDVKRDLLDVLLFDKIIVAEEDRQTKTELYLITAEAGSGKSIFLKRLSWLAAIEGNLLCIFIKRYGQINYDAMEEIINLTNERIFLFIDNASDNINFLEQFIGKAYKNNLRITIFTAERINEWNMGCCKIDKYVNGKYILPYLNPKEIDKLINLLDKNNCLGYLKRLNPKERIVQFAEKAGRQILVALHETTLGKPFEEILEDEYHAIRPKLAQAIYLSVCVLNRLKVKVRAGLISRLYGISFEEFMEKLFFPLEHVVEAINRANSYDYYYSARHSHIAEIVFERILIDENDRYNEYKKILSGLNISYSSDKISFRYLIRGKDLIKLFQNYELTMDIFKTAEEISKDDPYLFQQLGIYEMGSKDGNLGRANEYLLRARELDKNDFSIIHSLAELNRLKAEKAESYYEKEKNRAEALKYLSIMLDNNVNKDFAYTTLIKINIDEFKDLLNQKNPSNKSIDIIVNIIESNIERGLKEYPENSYLLELEYDFQKLLENEKKAFEALELAFKNNKHLPFIAIRLAKFYKSNNNLDLAIKTLKTALDVSPFDKYLNFQFAIILRELDVIDLTLIIYHLKKSFVKGDNNFIEKFWHARFCFESTEINTVEEGKLIFKELSTAPVFYEERNKIYDVIRENKNIKKFTGQIISKQETYGYLRRYGVSDTIFMHRNNVEEKIWNKLQNNQIVDFGIGFNFSGPIVINITTQNN
ncbi:MAG: P-loop NTPase [Candidatus Humimicrobiaceae bacterium]